MTIFLAILLKWVIKPDSERQYTGFDDDTNEQRQLALTNLGVDIEKGAKNERAYDRIRDKMAAKYGALTSGGDWKSKTKLSFVNSSDN